MGEGAWGLGSLFPLLRRFVKIGRKPSSCKYLCIFFFWIVLFLRAGGEGVDAARWVIGYSGFFFISTNNGGNQQKAHNLFICECYVVAFEGVVKHVYLYICC